MEWCTHEAAMLVVKKTQSSDRVAAILFVPTCATEIRWSVRALCDERASLKRFLGAYAKGGIPLERTLG